MQAASIEAATDAISFVALYAQAEGQVPGGDGIAERIGALGPVGEAANFVTDAGVHKEIVTFEFCGERGDRRRDEDEGAREQDRVAWRKHTKVAGYLRGRGAYE